MKSSRSSTKTTPWPHASVYRGVARCFCLMNLLKLSIMDSTPAGGGHLSRRQSILSKGLPGAFSTTMRTSTSLHSVKVSAGVGADQDYGNLFKTCLDSLGKPSGRPDGFFTHQPFLLNDAQTAFTHSITLAALSKASSASPLPNIRVPCSGVVFIKPHTVIRNPFNTPAANLKHFIHKFYQAVAEGGFSNTPEKSFQGFAARSLCDWNV